MNHTQQEAQSRGCCALVQTVLGAFLGIRKRADYQQDAYSFKPHHFIIAGVLGAVLFVVSLILIVKFVIL